MEKVILVKIAGGRSGKIHLIGWEENIFGCIVIYNLNILLCGMQRSLCYFENLYLEHNEK